MLENYQNKYGMSIKRVTIPSSPRLEGILKEDGPHAGVVICHPHPLYGGDMFSNVVEAMEEGFSSKGFTTLRFNFRGVGKSEGIWDEGKGEVDDLLAARTFLESHLDPHASIILAGYSFGAWICSKAAIRAPEADGLFLVAYPFAFYDTGELSRFRGKVYFVAGTRDDIGPVDALTGFYRDFPLVDKYLKIIPSDHFYRGKEGEIVDFIKENVTLG